MNQTTIVILMMLILIMKCNFIIIILDFIYKKFYSDSDADLIDQSHTNPAILSIEPEVDVPKPAAETFQDMIQGKKVLVNVSSLLALAHHKCHRSDCHEVIVRCTPIVSGCSIKLEIMCSANHLMEWHSCPNIMNKEGGSIPANNILHAAGILFSGNHFAKFFMFNIEY